MIFQFFLILTLSSAKVFASSEEQVEEELTKEQLAWRDLDENKKVAITYLNTVDSLLVHDLFTIELQALPVEVKQIIGNEYKAVFNEIKKRSELKFSFEFDVKDDPVNIDKDAKAALIQLDNKWESLEDKKKEEVKIYLRSNIVEKNIASVTQAVLIRFAKFLPDDDKHLQKPKGIFFVLRNKLGGLFGDELMGNGYSETSTDSHVSFLNTVIKLSTIKSNPQSNEGDLKEISTLLVEFKNAAEEEKRATEEEEKIAIAPDNQNAEEVKAEAKNAKEVAEEKATNVLKKLNDVWVKLKNGDPPPCEYLLEDYVNHVKMQGVYAKWFPSLIKSDAFKRDFGNSQDDLWRTGIFRLLLLYIPKESTTTLQSKKSDASDPS